ncbi:hypothetical protein PHYBOEH_008635 [Phytophthora boehmeriae]|uniref:Enoyl reductase (ER) domain-containing protein n=1 Tax=Phytophthora boehmeriae TaxID=109152 RepID=A0A8T1VZI4_9STRA|nr:hypothetical protein PHYBOEH_008635 [Phytophthora boehmeriae]
MSNIPATFKAFEYANFGDVLQEIKLNSQVPQKSLRSNEVRIKILSAAVNPLDHKLVSWGKVFLPTEPTAENPFRLGFDLAGVIVEIGSDDVRHIKVGDAVYAAPMMAGAGSFGEYLDIDATYVARKPINLTFNEAAGVPIAGQTSYQALITHGKLQAGERVLILGGSSATGLFGIQIAKAVGAEVITTASARNAELVKSVGADQVIEYTSQQWWDVLGEHSVDLIYDCGMEPQSWDKDAQRVLKQNSGIFVTIGLARNPVESPIGATFHRLFCMSSAECLQELTKLIEAGLVKTIIDSVHSLEKVPDAIKLQLGNKARGKIIIEIATE